jgi:hypothetical protein
MDKMLALTQYPDATVSYSFLVATDWSGGNVSTKIAAKAGYTIWIQRIMLSVTVDNAATQQFQDNAGTPIPVAKSKASPGLGPITWDFGEIGFPLTAGQAFQHLMSAAGMAGAVTVQAYYRPTVTT